MFLHKRILTLYHFTSRKMMPQGLAIFMHTVLTLIITASLLLNCILARFLVMENLRLQSFRFKDKLLLSMAASDILRALVGYALEMRVGILREGDTHRQCTAPAFIISFLSYASIYHLVATTFDRWLVIAKQHLAVKFHASNVGTSLVLLLSWLTSFLMAICPLFGFGTYGFEDRSFRCSVRWQDDGLLNRLYTMFLFVCCFILPLFAMVYFYFALRRFLRNSRDSMTGVFEGVTTRAIMKARFKAEGRVTSMFFVMAFVFTVSWAPYAVLSFLNAFASSSVDTNSIVQSVAVIPAKASTLYNPVVIAWYDQSFRQYLLRLLKCNELVCHAGGRVVPFDTTPNKNSKETMLGKPAEILTPVD